MPGTPLVIVARRSLSETTRLKLARAEVDAGDLIAGRAVAGGALGRENLRAVLNVGLKILRSAVLALSVSGRHTL